MPKMVSYGLITKDDRTRLKLWKMAFYDGGNLTKDFNKCGKFYQKSVNR